MATARVKTTTWSLCVLWKQLLLVLYNFTFFLTLPEAEHWWNKLPVYFSGASLPPQSSIFSSFSAGRCKMTSSYGSLVKEAVGLLAKFSAGRQCLSDFMEDAAKDLQVGGLTSGPQVLCLLTHTHIQTQLTLTFVVCCRTKKLCRGPSYWMSCLDASSTKSSWT